MSQNVTQSKRQRSLQLDITRGYFDDYKKTERLSGITRPSLNVFYSRGLYPISYSGHGALNRAAGFFNSPLDADVYLAIGNEPNKAFGNGFQVGEGALLFCVNPQNTSIDSLFIGRLTNGIQPFWTNVSVSRLSIATTGTVTAGNFQVQVSFLSINEIVTVNTTGGETVGQIAGKIVDACRNNSTLNTNFYFYVRVVSGVTYVYVERKTFQAGQIIIDLLPNSVNVQSANGVVLSICGTMPGTQFFGAGITVVKNGYYQPPMQLGVPELETPQLEIVPESQRGTGFDGIVRGSRSVVVARKRLGTISNGSGASAFVEPDNSTLYVYVPAIDNTISGLMADNSLVSDNTILLYFTYGSFGSTVLHKLFPLEIPEAELDGRLPPQLHTTKTAKYRVVSQHPTDQLQRIVEVEFKDSDLLLLEPFINHSTLTDSPIFVAKLGNSSVFLGLGKGDLGVDISQPNFYESVNLEWRYWLDSPPFAIASPFDVQGILWIGTQSHIWMAQWTGVTDVEAPIRLSKVTDKYAPISSKAMVAIGNRLFFVSKQKRVIVVTTDGQIDDSFGYPIEDFLNELITSPSNVCLGYDQFYNVLLIGYFNTLFACELSTGRWSAPIIIDGTEIVDIFNMNGKAMLVLKNNNPAPGFNPPSNLYVMYTFNDGDGALNWNLSAMPELGYNAKAVVEVKGIFKTTKPNENILFGVRKDFSTSVLLLVNYNIPSSIERVYARRWVESGDAEVVQPVLLGQRGGTTIVDVDYTIHDYFIEPL